MLMYAAFALNPNRELTTNTAWLKWKVDGGTTKGWLGLDTLVFRNEVFGVWETKRIENICDEDRVEVSVGEEGATAVITDADQLFGKSCESCQRHTVTSVQLIIMACITQIFQMCTALQRSTRYGDLNCQKLFGVSTSIFGFASTLSSLNLFRRACGLSSFFAPWTKQKTLDILIFGPNDDEGVYTPTRFNIRSGLAFTLLYVATVLKLIDVFFHLVTPTPSQKNHPYPHPEKLTLEEYMHIVVEDQPDTYKNSHNLPQKLDDDDDENASVGRVQSEAST